MQQSSRERTFKRAGGRTLSRMTGRAGVMSSGGALVADASLDLRPWRIPALLLGAVLACIATLALATLPSSTAPGTRPLALRHGLQSRLASSLPVTLAAAASASIGASERSFWPVRHGASLLTKGGGIHSTFTASGAALRVAGGTLGLSLTGVGRGQRLDPVAAVAPTGAADQVLYRHGSISEFYRNGPYGLEQGFTVLGPQASTGSLVLALGISGSLTPEQVGSQILFRTRSGVTALRYGQLDAVDATGRRLPAQMQLRNGALQLRIDTRNARGPLRIDPLIQQGEKLTGSGEVGSGLFGSSVALSSDGSTALIGAPFDNGLVGAAWVFTRSGETWTQQGEKLKGSGESGDSWFGSSVALSSDGNTAVIGGTGDNGLVGAAWVFTRSGETWTQQGEKLKGSGESGDSWFGSSVALSSDGNTAVIGGTGDNSHVGAAWVFTRSGETWTQQGSKLTGSGESGESEFGSSVALSSDGNTALIGGIGDNKEVGAAWVFTRSGSTWTQQGSKLTGSGEISSAFFGYSVALSSDGNTALIGGIGDNGDWGAAWVFTRSGETWTQQGDKLTGGGEISSAFFGYSVALSSGGNTALIGGHDDADVGAAWVFTRSGSTWTQQGDKLTGGGEIAFGAFGSSVALSSDGHTALIGGHGDNNFVGAAWVFVHVPAGPPPPVEKLSPKRGSAAGGTSVTIKGTELAEVTTVKFGSASATSFTVNSATSITARSPAGTTGLVDVTVTTPDGTSAISTKDRFTFGSPTVTGLSPNTGSKVGGTPVTVTGTGFALGSTTVLKFKNTLGTSVNCTTTTTCTVIAPAAAKAGTVDVRATVSGKTSRKAPADHFTYN